MESTGLSGKKREIEIYYVNLHELTISSRWEIPPATLSNAGRIVLMREKPDNRHAIEAVQVTDEELRDVIFGDPAMHSMELYKSRIDQLAIAEVTGRSAG